MAETDRLRADLVEVPSRSLAPTNFIEADGYGDYMAYVPGS